MCVRPCGRRSRRDVPGAGRRRPGTRGRERLPDVSFLTSLAGLVAIVVAWQLVVGASVAQPQREPPPTPTAIVRQMSKDGWSFYSPNVRATVSEAAKGWCGATSWPSRWPCCS